MLVLRNLLLGLLLAWQSMALGQGVLAVPQLSGRVIDQAGTLDAATRRKLADKLLALETEKGFQVVLLLVPNTAPEDIASYANRVANEWKIGPRKVGDGVLLVPQGSSSLQGFQWFDLVIFLMVGAPMIAAVLRGIFGRMHGAPC